MIAIAMDRENLHEAIARLEKVSSYDHGKQALSRKEVKRLRAEVAAMTDDELSGYHRIIKTERALRLARQTAVIQAENDAIREEQEAKLEERRASAQQRLDSLGLSDIFKVTGVKDYSRGGGVYIEIAKPGSKAGPLGTEITMEILDRLESLSA
jgi:ribosomal protein L17